MKPNTDKILLSPLFIIGLILLLLNDFYLKFAFSNLLTGKISDFAGLFIFPIFWSAFFPKRKLSIYVSTAIFFIFWKSPFSQILIDYWNSFEILRIGRVVDYSDLIALFVLPFSYKYFLNFRYCELVNLQLRKFATFAVIVISVFAFTATSYENERTIYLFGNNYEVKMNINNLEQFVKNEKSFEILTFERESDKYSANQLSNREIDPTQYYLYFDIKQSFCESNKLRIFLPLNTQKDKVVINSPTIHYWCSQPPNDNDKAKLTEIFEREVIEKIRQNSSQ